MRKFVALSACMALGATLSFNLAGADGSSDVTPPVTTLRTEDGSTLINPILTMQDRLAGAVTDDLSGVIDVILVFTPLAGEVIEQAADLGCADESQVSCGWRALPPYAPGRYGVDVHAVDMVGNIERDGPHIEITVI